MAAVPSEQEFEVIVRNLMSPDNTLRNQAESMYASIKANTPGWLVQALCHVLKTSQDHALRQMCAVILRRAVAKLGPESVFPSLSPDLQTETKALLLQLVAAEQQKPVRRSLAFCISGLGAYLCERGEWAELFPFLFTGVKDGPPPLKQSCLSIFSSLVGYLEDSFLNPFLGVLRDAFQFALAEQHPLEVRVAAVDAVSSLVSLLEEDEQVKGFQILVPDILKVVGQALAAKEEDKAVEAIESMVSIAEESPEFYALQLAETYSAMVQIIGGEQLEDSVRQLAVEFCLTLAENDPRGTKKIPQFVEAIFPLALQFLTKIQEEKNWAVTSEDDDDMEMTFYDVGLEALDRLSLALGGRLIEPLATGLIGQYLTSGSWEHRHAGLMALCQCAEGCSKQMEAKLGAMVQTVLKLMGDPHERVRWAAVHCLAQLSNDFAPGLQTTFHPTILPALMAMLGDPVPRIVAHAADAVVNFLDEAPAPALVPYLDELVTKLLLVLQSNPLKFVSEEVLAAFAAVAENSEQNFLKYYDHIVPYVKQLLAQPPQDKRDRMLRAKAMECVSLIGMSVGKERFGGDAKEVLELLHRTLATTMAPDDPQAQYIFQAWARIAKCLQEDFAQYLPHVVPLCLQQASVQTDVTVTDVVDGVDDDKEDEEGVETLTLAIKGVGDKRIQIKTSMLQDKALACSVLESLLEDVPLGMGQYVEQVSQLMVPLLPFAYLSDIRETASKCLPLLLKALPPAHSKPDLLRHFIAHLLDAIKAESDVDVACTLVENFRKCVDACDTNSLPDDLVAHCSNILKKVFDESLRRRKLVVKKQKEAHDDDDEVEKLEADADGEEMLLGEVVETVGVMVKKAASFLPFFATTFFPMCMDLLGDKYGDVERRLALCAFDDFVEHGSKVSAEAVAPFLQPIITALMRFTTSQDADVMQAAAYGLGVCAQYGGATFHQVAAEVTQQLVKIVKDDTFDGAVANAVSSLVKMIKFQGSHPSGLCRMEALGPVVLSKLPVEADEIEARFIHGEVVEWVLAKHPVVLGEGGANLPAILTLCRRLLDTDLATDATKAQMRQILA